MNSPRFFSNCVRIFIGKISTEEVLPHETTKLHTVVGQHSTTTDMRKEGMR